MQQFEKFLLGLFAAAIAALFLLWLIHMSFKFECIKGLKDKSAADIRVVCND